MRALIQRTARASVTVGDRVIGETGPGLLVLVCAMRGDGETESAWLARKTVNLRIFRDDEGRMNRSLLDTGGAALVVSQFTLAAETKATVPASRPPPRRRKANGSTVTSPSRSAVTAWRWKPATSAPTCRSRWSTTAR